MGIAVAAPFRLDLTVWALRRRASNETDRWDGACYRRALDLPEGPADVAVTQTAPPDAPRLHVAVEGHNNTSAARAAVRAALQHTLGLRIDLAPFYAVAAADPQLAALVSEFRGMRPPRFPSLFEALVNAISCQQISLEAGLSLINRLVRNYGRSPAGIPDAGKTFPRPEDLADVQPEQWRALGFSRQKSSSILRLAEAIGSRCVGGEGLALLDDDAARRSLETLRGVGRWTSEYVLLRGLGRLNVFPGDDVGAQNNLRRWLGEKRALDYDRVKQIVRRWQPYAGLVYLHLLLRGLADAGVIAREPGIDGARRDAEYQTTSRIRRSRERPT